MEREKLITWVAWRNVPSEGMLEQGGKIHNAIDCCKFLQGKFGNKSDPSFHILELTHQSLDEAREEARWKDFPTIKGSDEWHVIVFKPNATKFKAASYLCVCETCLDDYGSCELFSMYQLKTKQLNKPHLRSSIQSTTPAVDSSSSIDFVVPETYCALAAEQNSADLLWFVKIEQVREPQTSLCTDDYGHSIAPGYGFVEGHFLEKSESTSKGHIFKQQKKKTFFFPESVVYPFVQFEPQKKGLFFSNVEYGEILNFIEAHGLSHI